MKKYILFILTFLMICSCNTSVNSSSSSVSSSSSGINENEQNLNRLVEYINETLIPAYSEPNISMKREEIISYYNYKNLNLTSRTKLITIIDENNNFYRGYHHFSYGETIDDLKSESYRDLIVVDSKIYKDYYALPSGKIEKKQAILSDEEEIKRYQNFCTNFKKNRIKVILSDYFNFLDKKIVNEEPILKLGEVAWFKETDIMIEFIVDTGEYDVELISPLPEITTPQPAKALNYGYVFINKATKAFEFKQKSFIDNELKWVLESKISLNHSVNAPENIEDYEMVDHLEVYYLM